MDGHGWTEQPEPDEHGWPYDETETNGYRTSRESAATETGPSSRNIFGDHLRELRHAVGLTQQALADRVGVSAAMLSHLEAGRRGASAEILTKLESALGLTAEQLGELDFLAQIAGLSADHQKRIRVDVAWPAIGASVPEYFPQIEEVGTLADPRPDLSEKCDAPASVVEARLLNYLLETQFRSALDGHFKSEDRIARLAAVVRGLQELDSDDLLRVSGFLAGLRAAKVGPTSL